MNRSDRRSSTLLHALSITVNNFCFFLLHFVLSFRSIVSLHQNVHHIIRSFAAPLNPYGNQKLSGEIGEKIFSFSLFSSYLITIVDNRSDISTKAIKVNNFRAIVGYKLIKLFILFFPFIHSIQCDICNKAFTRNRDMVLHKRKIHLNERSPAVKCPECRKVFPTDDSLQLHLVKDHNQVPVAPEIQPDIAPQQQQLQQPIHHGPSHHLHPHHQPFIQPPPPLLPPPAMSYQHARLHPY